MYIHKALKFLPDGSTIVLDNASCHTHLKIAPVLKKTRSTLKYLPPYSPELNPIEKLWASVKKIMTKLSFQTKDFFALICQSLSHYKAELELKME